MEQITCRSLFVSHGSPMLALSQHPSAKFLRELGPRIAKPRAAIVISPHWQAHSFAVKSAPRYEAWHDFGGFPQELYSLQYAPAGDASLADRVADAIDLAHLPTGRVEETRIDHGVWMPLKMMWPEADVPLVQVAVGPGGAPAAWQLGEALAPLLGDGVILIASGSPTHNLRTIRQESAPPASWAVAFDDWLAAHIVARNEEALIHYRRSAPHAVEAHPTDEHLLPIFAAAAVGTEADGPVQTLHRGFTHGTLSMASYAFP